MDRLVFSQDGVQRASGRWSYYLYDAFGRLTEEGECTVKSPLGGKTVHVRHLYDSYGFLGTEGFTGGVYPAATVSGQGKLTGRVSLATDGSGTAQNLYTAYYYDTRGRVTQAVQSNLLGGHDVTNTVYTFTGKPAVVSHTQEAHTYGGHRVHLRPRGAADEGGAHAGRRDGDAGREHVRRAGPSAK